MRSAHLDATRFAARTRMNLRLNNPYIALYFSGALHCFDNTVGQTAFSDLDAVFRQDFFCLIFVNVQFDVPNNCNNCVNLINSIHCIINTKAAISGSFSHLSPAVFDGNRFGDFHHIIGHSLGSGIN